jgi:hypothetical protein
MAEERTQNELFMKRILGLESEYGASGFYVFFN